MRARVHMVCVMLCSYGVSCCVHGVSCCVHGVSCCVHGVCHVVFMVCQFLRCSTFMQDLHTWRVGKWEMYTVIGFQFTVRT